MAEVEKSSDTEITVTQQSVPISLQSLYDKEAGFQAGIVRLQSALSQGQSDLAAVQDLIAQALALGVHLPEDSGD